MHFDQKAETAANDDDDAETLRKKRLAEGTPVTAETFAKWARAFEQEMASKRVVDVVHTKLTGKQMFVQHLVTEEDEEGDNDNDEFNELLQGEEEDLFLDEDLDDLEDDES